MHFVVIAFGLIVMLGVGRLNGWLLNRAGWRALAERHPEQPDFAHALDFKRGSIWLASSAYVRWISSIAVDGHFLHLKLPALMHGWLGVPRSLSIPWEDLESGGEPDWDGIPFRVRSTGKILRLTGPGAEEASRRISSTRITNHT